MGVRFDGEGGRPLSHLMEVCARHYGWRESPEEGGSIIMCACIHIL